jgi:tetratricopeptide (TPR) repeat protein
VKRRFGIPIALVLALVAVAIVLQPRKEPPTRNAERPAGDTLTTGEKARIRGFWESYREGLSLKLEGRWEEAIAAFRRALELDPDHENSLFNIANCYLELDRTDEALDALEHMVRVNPQSQRGYYQIGLVHACPLEGYPFDLEAAEQALRRAFEINKEESGALLRLGEVVLVRGKPEEALEYLSLANRSNFRAVEGYYLRGYIRWKEGRDDEARELLAEAIEQSRAKKVVPAVPGEGDTKVDAELPPTRMEEKLLFKRFWDGIGDRHEGNEVGPGALESEFHPLDEYVEELRSRH